MKKLQKIIGVILSTLSLGAVIITAANSFNIQRTKASTYNTTLNNSNSPELNNGSGTMTDNKNVTWEYNGVSDYQNGHITINPRGYFGISSTSDWGYTKIESVNAIFVDHDTSNDETFWLLKSTDGTNWHEAAELKSGVDTDLANDWRYIRFYSYEDIIDITSVSIGYACSGGISASEDVDSARVSNVVTTEGLSYSNETTNISPNSVGGEAVRFTKSGTSSTTLTISFGKSYTLKDVAYDKIEFDIWTENVAYGKTIEVLNTDNSYKSNKFTAASGLHVDHPTDSYVWTALGNNWYHVELPITALVSLISGYGSKDIPSESTLKKQFNAIKINQGTCVIDNLRIGSSETELGLYNSATYKPSVGEIYWAKISWVGKLYPSDCYITFEDNSLARYIPYNDTNLLHESPFYFEILGAGALGTLTYTAHVVCGYNHRTYEISKTITIN